MSDLATFLLERIAEDEAMARACIAEESQTRQLYGGREETLTDQGVWRTGPEGKYDECRVDGTFMTIYDEGGHSREQAVHIARHDPARVLAECAAKRRIVETLVDMEALPESERVEQRVTLRWVCQLLALPYADHLDYRAKWRP